MTHVKPKQQRLGLLRYGLIAIAASLLAVTDSLAQTRYFTVRDSIEMTRFLRQPKVEFSPDKHYFAVVTSHGIIRADAIESTIWVFSTEAVQKFLRAPDAASTPVPKAIIRWTAVPRAEYFNSTDESVISGVQWYGDSKTILFLAQNRRGERQLYATTITSGAIHAVTSPGYDVKDFLVTHNSIVYETTRAAALGPGSGVHSNRDALDVTGMPIMRILFSQNNSPAGTYNLVNYGAYNTLWIISHGKHRILGRNVLPNDRWPNNLLAVSPDDRTIVVITTVAKIPFSWQTYEPNTAYHLKKIDPDNPKFTSVFNANQATEYALVNLDDGRITPLIDAPLGYTLGYLGDISATWSKNGKAILLTNTFLPLEGIGMAERMRRRYPCPKAIVSIIFKTIRCSAFDNPKSFMPANQFAAPLTGGASGFSVAVKQDLNTPPALWATDTKTGKAKKLWEPNPQLSARDLSEASVFRWKDSTGYTWTAGLLKPPNYLLGKRYPLIIQTHGFFQGEFLSEGGYATALAARPLASAGFVVLQMNYDSDHMVSAQELPDQIRGFTSAIAQLASSGLVDSARVGVIGWSRTYYYVEGALIQNPKLFAAAAISDGTDESYLQYLFGVDSALTGADSDISQPEGDRIYGAPPFGKGLAAWVKSAPGFNLDRVQTPLRIEAIGPFSLLSEWEIYAPLRLLNKPVDFVYIPDGQHILQKPLERMASEQGNVDWFRFWLQGYEDPDPSKAARYAYWRKLRAFGITSVAP